ncbi:hypothetical protein [Roseovarius indicus]|jgi:hypothetical protein|uniref:Uncharacterized protein n=1 Tax=Roseovarius indicus TaxID=540747 RepID=A0A0T5P5D0_9RHOB|nr:hypothetical protein [Roseovarius indicus]KRS16310.1 hypothetical protein XM52_19845 [Roseovarius indicus]OAO08292.1 hypothetical protein A8B76_26545 [Roseovarius indicus]QEW27528.1 hypothetical protein RIdsm_03344 [Roseovarius indicus]SFD46701.1 hypothetical protein SAMN04488031_1011 [Roseovarius indicus]
MRISLSLSAAALAALTALPAVAQEARLYPVPTNANYCPAGLQPITINGAICCGRPNTHVTWYEMKRHPVYRAATYTRSYNCPEGTKGCQ